MLGDPPSVREASQSVCTLLSGYWCIPIGCGQCSLLVEWSKQKIKALITKGVVVIVIAAYVIII